MVWAFATSALVVCGVGYLLVTIVQIHGAEDEDDYFARSIRFWSTLGLLGIAVGLAFMPPLLSMVGAVEGMSTTAALLTMALVWLPVAVLSSSGIRNAALLRAVRRRRRRAMAAAEEVEARVVARDRRLFGHDIVDITVEARVPDPRPDALYSYRECSPSVFRTVRFVETCPGDQWSRFSVGSTVRLRFDPADPHTFAVVLFDPA